ncbi:MAG TPA: DapH/DapD/GlmU-related protein [Pseudomonadales bacterium]|jgi:2,3,4,5-tetrahydropyridine-2-carboxylate N-succinyltransferase|nr:DapH/DapD/GlmU-related protein [Pseudomonadales bacterium]
MSELFGFGIGHATFNRAGVPLEVFFPAPCRNPGVEVSAAIRTRLKTGVSSVSPADAAALSRALEDAGAADAAHGCRVLAEIDKPLTGLVLERDAKIESTVEAYFKLQLLSHRLALPNTLNLDGIFAQLPNVAWTSDGAIDVSEFEAALLAARRAGRPLTVHSLDKFPRMTDYVIPSGVRIADAARIRLGAYLGEGTTVMHEGFVNFNAGALGPNMIEGRISQGVIVAEHTDLGGSSSTMGTLSGGGNIKVSIGRHCLIGANGGTGISLGDRCTIEAGLYITAGTVVDIIDEDRNKVRTAKGRELSGASDMLFIRNSRTGAVECRTNRAAIKLNEQLHAHN